MSKTLGETIIFLINQGYSVRFDQDYDNGLNIKMVNEAYNKSNFTLSEEIIKRINLPYDNMLVVILERMFFGMSQPNTILNVDEWLARLEKLKEEDEDEEEKENERV